MGYLAQFVIAGETEGQAVADASNPLRIWRGFDSGDVNERHLASLFFQVSHHRPEGGPETAEGEPCDGYYDSQTDPTAFTMRLSQSFLVSLRNIGQAERTSVGHEWASHEDLEGLDPQEVTSCLAQLCELAHEAQKTGMRIMLWMGE